MTLDYVEDIYMTLMEAPKQELKETRQELERNVPPPLHSMLDKEDAQEAVNRHKGRKEKETPICPPTCSGKYF